MEHLGRSILKREQPETSTDVFRLFFRVVALHGFYGAKLLLDLTEIMVDDVDQMKLVRFVDELQDATILQS